MSSEFYWIAVALVAITGASRITRLVTFDKFPPAAWVREKYADLTDGTERRREWTLLLYCGWCFSFWAMALVVAWGYLAGVFESPEQRVIVNDSFAYVAWWLVNGTLGGSYLAAMLMARDGDSKDGE